MIFYRVVLANDAITTAEGVGEGVDVLHKTRAGAEAEKRDLDQDWDPEWGTSPALEITEVEYPSIEAAVADDWQIFP